MTSVAAVVSASASGYIAVTSSGGLDQVSITGDDDVRTITQADLLSFMSLSDVDGDTTGPDTAAAAANSITILSDGETADTLNWNFDSIAETFDFLGLGETLELTYTVEVDDQNGVETASGTDGEVSTTTETITILITGTNDQPEIAVIDNTAGGAGDLVYETNAALGDTLGEPAAISGSFTITDIDTTDVVTRDGDVCCSSGFSVCFWLYCCNVLWRPGSGVDYRRRRCPYHHPGRSVVVHVVE